MFYLLFYLLFNLFMQINVKTRNRQIKIQANFMVCLNLIIDQNMNACL